MWDPFTLHVKIRENKKRKLFRIKILSDTCRLRYAWNLILSNVFFIRKAVPGWGEKGRGSRKERWRGERQTKRGRRREKAGKEEKGRTVHLLAWEAVGSQESPVPHLPGPHWVLGHGSEHLSWAVGSPRRAAVLPGRQLRGLRVSMRGRLSSDPVSWTLVGSGHGSRSLYSAAAPSLLHTQRGPPPPRCPLQQDSHSGHPHIVPWLL